MTESPAFHAWLQPRGFLEPFIGDDARDFRTARSPYPMDLESLVQYFGWSPRRRELIRSLMIFRKRLKLLGVTTGFQWIDGSFLEHSEELRHAEPQDLDVVTWIPSQSIETYTSLRALLPDRADIKQELGIDALFAPCTPEGWLEPSSACYWLGLFGHTRKREWKGIAQLNLAEIENEGILDQVMQ